MLFSPDRVAQLIAAGETTVERKQALPSDGLAPTMASFANSQGGWVLLGVRNDGSVNGYTWKGKGDLQDHLRDHLVGTIDPLPPFAAAPVEYEGRLIGVVRVAASADAPHVVTATGALYVRVPGGKAPVADHRTLLALAQRARDAERAARRDRLHGLPEFEHHLMPVMSLLGDQSGGLQEPILEWIVRAAPVTVHGTFADAALRASTAANVAQRLRGVLPEHTRAGVYDPEPRPRGFYVVGGSTFPWCHADVAVDAAGKIGVRYAVRRERGVISLPELEATTLVPLLRVVRDTMEELDALGRVLLQLQVRQAASMMVAASSLRVGELQLHGTDLYVGGELALPADDADLSAIAQRWTRELARAARLPAWEPELDAG